jgi:DNA-binding transcriptional regulator GbsR (MarR family)
LILRREAENEEVDKSLLGITKDIKSVVEKTNKSLFNDFDDMKSEFKEIKSLILTQDLDIKKIRELLEQIAKND